METNTEIWPIVIGALVTIITTISGAWIAARSQRIKLKAEADAERNKSRIEAEKAVHETQRSIYQLAKEDIESLNANVDRLREQLREAEKERTEAVDTWYRERQEMIRTWETERRELASQLDKATNDLAKMSQELAESYTEINELRQTIDVVRQEAKRQIDNLQSEVKALREENHRLKNGSGRRKDF